MKLTLFVDDEDGTELLKSALDAELVFWRSVAKEGTVAHAKAKCVALLAMLDQVERQAEAREEKRR